MKKLFLMLMLGSFATMFVACDNSTNESEAEMVEEVEVDTDGADAGEIEEVETEEVEIETNAEGDTVEIED